MLNEEKEREKIEKMLKNIKKHKKSNNSFSDSDSDSADFSNESKDIISENDELNEVIYPSPTRRSIYFSFNFSKQPAEQIITKQDLA